MRTTLASLAAAALLLATGVAYAQDMPGKGVTVNPAATDIAGEEFQHRILFRALEDLGFTVADPVELRPETFHVAVQTGDADFNAAHWKVLHTEFYNESDGGGELQRVGSLVAGAVQGYLVDKASYDGGIRNLGDLTDPSVAERFDADGDGTADLAGCGPGWGCELVIEHHLDEFGLRDTISHNQGSYDAIIADSIARLANGEAILFYTWTPYWVTGEMVPGVDVEWLEVPYASLPGGATGETMFNGRELGFALDSIHVIARKEFLDANPSARALFEVATIDVNDISAQNLKMSDKGGGEDSDADIDRHVDEWISANRATYDSWLETARAAAN